MPNICKCNDGPWPDPYQFCPACGERLSPIGSGATTCFGGREADGETRQADEERSDREDRRVSPGEAEAFAYVADYLESKARELQEVIDDEPWPLEDPEGVQQMEDLADELREAAQTVRNATPEPDSDAPLGASGRRNAEP